MDTVYGEFYMSHLAKGSFPAREVGMKVSSKKNLPTPSKETKVTLIRI